MRGNLNNNFHRVTNQAAHKLNKPKNEDHQASANKVPHYEELSEWKGRSDNQELDQNSKKGFKTPLVKKGLVPLNSSFIMKKSGSENVPPVPTNDSAALAAMLSVPPPNVSNGGTEDSPVVASADKKNEMALKADAQTAWSLLHEYWTFVQENPYDFNGWSYLLTHVESMKHIEAARSAFKGFLPLYPYCFAYWKKLADLELKFCMVPRSLGVLIYGTKSVPLCHEIWINLFTNFKNYAKQENLSVDITRFVYKSGLERIGLSWHSSPFWEECIKFELEQNDFLKVMTIYKWLISIPIKVYNKHWDQLVAVIRDNHPQRILSLDVFDHYYRVCCDQLKIKYVQPQQYNPEKPPKIDDQILMLIKEKILAGLIKIHEENAKQVDKRWKFEEKIKRPYFHVKPIEKKQLKAWNDYLDFEIKQGDPIRTLILFERCLVSCAQYEEMWCRYASFLEMHVQQVANGKYKDVVYRPGVFSADKAADTEAAAKLGKSSLNETDVMISTQKGVWFDFYYDIAQDVKAEGAALIEQLCDDVEVGSRVLTCPVLTPSWILTEVTNEDVRQVYRRASWIHCPSKPLILMQWAEFEESQGDIQTARDLLNTVLSKHPQSMRARMQLIDLERRGGMLDRVEELYSQAFTSYKDPKEKSFIAIRFARFLFKFKDDFDTSLALIRKALKKDKGNVFLYNQVFNICYEKRPVDCDGVMAAVMLALASKELNLDQKKQFCLQRAQFLKEHGTITQIKDAQLELSEIQAKLDAIKDEEEKVEKEKKRQEELKMKEIERLANEQKEKEAKRAEELKRENALELGELTKVSDTEERYAQPRRMTAMKRFDEEEPHKMETRRKRRRRKRSSSPRDGHPAHSRRPHDKRRKRSVRNEGRDEMSRKSKGSTDNHERSKSDRTDVLPPPPQPDGILTRTEFSNGNSFNGANPQMSDSLNQPPPLHGHQPISRNSFMEINALQFNGGQPNIMRPPPAGMYEGDMQQRPNQQQMGDGDMQRNYSQRQGDPQRPHMPMGDGEMPRMFPHRPMTDVDMPRPPLHVPIMGDADRNRSFPQQRAIGDDLQRPPPHLAVGEGDLQRPPPRISMGDGDLNRPPPHISMDDTDMQQKLPHRAILDGDLQKTTPQRAMSADGDMHRPPLQRAMADGNMNRPPPDRGLGANDMQRLPPQRQMNDAEMQRPPHQHPPVMGDQDMATPPQQRSMGPHDMQQRPMREPQSGVSVGLLGEFPGNRNIRPVSRGIPALLSLATAPPSDTRAESPNTTGLRMKGPGLMMTPQNQGSLRPMNPLQNQGQIRLRGPLPNQGQLMQTSLVRPQQAKLINMNLGQPQGQQRPINLGQPQRPQGLMNIGQPQRQQGPMNLGQPQRQQGPINLGQPQGQQRPINLGQLQGQQGPMNLGQQRPINIGQPQGPMNLGQQRPINLGQPLGQQGPMNIRQPQGQQRPPILSQPLGQQGPMNLGNQKEKKLDETMSSFQKISSYLGPPQGQHGSMNPGQSQGHQGPMNPGQSQGHQGNINPGQSQGHQGPMNPRQGQGSINSDKPQGQQGSMMNPSEVPQNVNPLQLHNQKMPMNPAGFNDSIGPFNAATKGPPFQPNIVSVPRNLSATPPGGPILNVPDWLIAEGGEFKLSQGPKGDCVLKYWPRFMNEIGHDTLLSALRKSIKWLNQKVNVQGNWSDVPMMMSWLGPCEYKKDGVALNANPNWPPEIVDLLHTLSRVCEMETQFNSCLLRLFRNGYDHQAWDSEEHPAMNTNPKIAVVSVGAVRSVEMRHKNGPEYVRFPLLPGSLLFMEGATQTDWIHQITKDPKVGAERISLSFRTMLMINGLTV